MLCSICKHDKNESEFNFRNLSTQTRYKHCKSCQQTIRQQSYQRNRKYFLEYSKTHYKDFRQAQRDFIKTFKSGKPCNDCGCIYPYYVMDFDHLPQFKKSFSIASDGFYRSKKTLLTEFAKCEIVCANCHRIRTWKRKQK